MASFKYLFRPSTRGQNYLGSLSLQIIHRRKVKIMTLPYKLYPNEWDKLKQEVIIQSINVRKNELFFVQEKLTNCNSLFYNIIEKLEFKEEYELEDIIREYHLLVGKISLSNYTNKLIGRLERNGQQRTARAYRSATARLLRFNKGKDIPLKAINITLINDFEQELKDCGLSLNTISFYMRNLRVICKKAIEEGVMERPRDDPFKDVFTGVDKTLKRALEIQQIRRLYELDYSHILSVTNKKKQLNTSVSKRTATSCSGLYTGWRLFFFCFYARGMSFIDMAYLRKENLRKGTISYYRRKTGQRINIKVTPEMLQIIDSFSQEVRYSPYLFPVIRDRNKSTYKQYESGLYLQNKRLKKLARMAGISSRLTTHVSRHTWATTARRANLPVSVISEGLGHSNERTTYIYLASFNSSILDKANEVVSATLRRTIKPRRSTSKHIDNITSRSYQIYGYYKK